MQIGKHNVLEAPFFIAEIGNNHEGSVRTAEKLVQAAAMTGVQAVKFQTFVTEHFINPEQRERFERIKQFQLSFQEFEHLARIARDEGLIFLSTPFDLESADFLNSLVPAFKIGSSENTHYPLLKKVASFDKPIILSTGLLPLDGIKALLDFLTPHLASGGQNQLALLHCVTQYPTPASRANLNRILTLKRHFSCVIGYSDHVIGIIAALSAGILGAAIIEKHFTLDHSFSSFRDHQLSATPDEMRQLVQQVLEARACLQELTSEEEEEAQLVADTVRRSIVVCRDMSSGEVIQEKDLGWTRPAGGLYPGQEALVIGKSLIRSMKAGERVLLSDVTDPA